MYYYCFCGIITAHQNSELTHLPQEKIMRTYRLEQSDREITSHAGVALIGAAIEKYTTLGQSIDRALPKRHGTPTSDMIKTYLGIQVEALEVMMLQDKNYVR